VAAAMEASTAALAEVLREAQEELMVGAAAREAVSVAAETEATRREEPPEATLLTDKAETEALAPIQVVMPAETEQEVVEDTAVVAAERADKGHQVQSEAERVVAVRVILQARS